MGEVLGRGMRTLSSRQWESLKVLMFQTPLYGCSDTESCKAIPAWNAVCGTIPLCHGTHPATQTRPQHRDVHAQRNTLIGTTTHTDTDAAAHSHTCSSRLHGGTTAPSTPKHIILHSHTCSHTTTHTAGHQRHGPSHTPPLPARSHWQQRRGTGGLTPWEATAVNPELPCPRPQSLLLGAQESV